jgi:hypothetical protein
MTFCTARVAPEKAVFRPALPPHSPPEFTGEHMAKLSYSEQLKHPNWQRKRLAVLDAAGWKCATCDASEKTLHVHHKQYVKGRLPWEYEVVELEALCEDCHEEAHKAKALIDSVIAQFPSIMWNRIGAMLVGYGEEYVDPANWLEVTEDFARAGQVAWFMGNLAPEDACEMQRLCEELNPTGVLQALRDAAQREIDAAFDSKPTPQPDGKDSIG